MAVKNVIFKQRGLQKLTVSFDNVELGSRILTQQAQIGAFNDSGDGTPTKEPILGEATNGENPPGLSGDGKAPSAASGEEKNRIVIKSKEN